MDARADRRNLKLAAGVFLLTLFVYAWFFGGTGWNQNASFALTRAIVEQGTIRIDSFAESTGDRALVRGHWYSNKTPGTAFLAVVPYFVIYHAERVLGIDSSAPLIAARNLYLCTAAVSGISGAAIAAMLLLYARAVPLSRRLALAVACLVAFGTPLFAYATVLFVHVPNGALLLGAYLAASHRQNDRGAALAGFLGGWGALTNYQCVPFVAFLALFMFSGQSRVRRLAFCFAAAAVPLAALAWYQYSAFGTLFTNPITENDMFVTHDAWFGMIRPPQMDALWGITFSPYRGLFYLSPVLLLALAGFIPLMRRRDYATLFFMFLVGALFVGFNVTFNGWRGGNGIGPRYLVPLIPFLGVLLAEAASFLPRALLALSGVVSLFLNFAATAVDPQAFEHIRDPLGEHILPVLLTGRPDLQRLGWLAPGRTSINTDSFNLGELAFGSGSALSLVPLLLVAVAALLLLARDAGGAVPE